MGRKAGVSAAQTRSELVTAAARVFARKGYDGATIADITSEAGLSSGAIYAHFGSKAELFVAVIRDGAERDFSEAAGFGRVGFASAAERVIGDLGELVTAIGSEYDRTRPEEASLLIEAVVAAKRDPEVAVLVRDWLHEVEILFGALVAKAQSDGTADPAIGPAAASRFITMVSLGAFLTSALDLPRVDHDEWRRLIESLVDSIRRGAPS